MGRREIFSWGGAIWKMRRRENPREVVPCLPWSSPVGFLVFFLCGPLEGREIFKIIIFLVSASRLSSGAFWFFWCGSIWDLYHFDLCLCKKNFDVSASRSSPICLLVLLFWSFAKLELREIIFFLVSGKKMYVSASRSSLVFFLVLLVWSNEKS